MTEPSFAKRGSSVAAIDMIVPVLVDVVWKRLEAFAISAKVASSITVDRVL
jgi:hypothetical protein